MLDLAVALHNAKQRLPFLRAEFDYQKLITLGGLVIVKGESPTIGEPMAEGAIYSFTINFDANKEAFDMSTYAQDFEKALKDASLFGRAAIVVRDTPTPRSCCTSSLRQAWPREPSSKWGALANTSIF